MGRSGAALGIIGVILGAGAIGFSFVVLNGQNNLIDELNNLTRTIVVGVWAALIDNYGYAPHNLTNDWLFEFGVNNLSNSDYIFVSNNNTRIALSKSGWYRIHLSVLYWFISTNFVYETRILKDGAFEFAFDRLVTGATVDSYWHHIDSSAFVYSNGRNYIEVNGYSEWDNNFRPFTDAAHDYNQLTIEYIAL